MMVGFRALGAVWLSLSILCSGCVSWDRPVVADAATTPALRTATPPASAPAPEVTPPPQAPSARPLPALSNEPEDFVCLDGSQLRVRYRGGRDIAVVSLNGGAPIAMRRADEAGLTAYRASNLVFRRSGVRAALASDVGSVTVQSGDTLGQIALRVYGDRTRALDIARINGVENPDLIFPGQVLRLGQTERRCRRSYFQEASAMSDGAVRPGPMQR